MSLVERYQMALDEVARRMERICHALEQGRVEYALVGGQAVALWVATRDPDAVRTTKDVDLLLRRSDVPAARAAAQPIGLDYFEVVGVGMLLQRSDPHPRRGVHLIWAGEKVRPEYDFPAPQVGESLSLAEGIRVVALPGLVQMKLTSYRDQDRVHLRDMIEVGLIDRVLLAQLPSPLAARLEGLLLEAGR
jgi:hypothetical protein